MLDRWQHNKSGFAFLSKISLVFATISLSVSTIAGQETATTDRGLQDHWHQWRGPLNNGMAPSAKPVLNWSEQKNILWKVAVPGEGISSPVIWGKRVFLISAVETDREPEEPQEIDSRTRTRPPNRIFEFMVWCFDLETGKQIWKRKAGEAAPFEGRHQTSTYAASSPMTDGKHLIASFGSYGIFCYDLDGKILWKRDLGDMHTRRGWGEGVSPVICQDRVVVMWDQEDQSKIFALNLQDGKTVWQKDREEPTTWATPLCVEHDGQVQVITNGTTRLRSYNLKDGEIIWQAKGTTLNAIPCPILFEKNVVCMAGYRGNRAVSIKIDSRGMIEDENVNWEVSRGTPYVPSPCLSGERLYFTSGNRAILNCLNIKTGKPIFDQVRLPGQRSLYASPIVADGRVYLPGREGMTLVFKDADKFELLASNKLDDRFDASPVAVGDKLLLRGHKHLYCIGKKDQ